MIKIFIDSIRHCFHRPCALSQHARSMLLAVSVGSTAMVWHDTTHHIQKVCQLVYYFRRKKPASSPLLSLPLHTPTGSSPSSISTQLCSPPKLVASMQPLPSPAIPSSQPSRPVISIGRASRRSCSVRPSVCVSAGSAATPRTLAPSSPPERRSIPHAKRRRLHDEVARRESSEVEREWNAGKGEPLAECVILCSGAKEGGDEVVEGPTGPKPAM